jgi:hypothetical protein
MRKLLISGLAALTFATAVAPATGAVARDYRYYNYGHRHHGDDGAWVAAGIVGLALGAALASSGSHDHYYDDRYYGGRRYYRESYYDDGYRPYYGNGYYARGYYRPYAYSGGCRTTTQWDPWDDAYVRRTHCW